MPALGRLYIPDERDSKYPFSLSAVTPIKTHRYWIPGAVLDQGNLPHCVAFSWKGWLMSSPIRQGNLVDPSYVYNEAQKIDDWPGEGYAGTSVRAGAKILQDLGFISDYLWAYNVTDIKNWILATSPVVVGTNWYRGMSTPDEKQYVTLSGDILGGHAYLIYGYSHTRGAFRCLNSWGMDYGQKGRFWLKYYDLERLLSEQGEACTAIEKKHV